MPDAPPLSTAEAAELLRCHVSSISRFVKDGELVPTMRIGGGPGGSMFFDRSDVEALAAKRAERPVEPDKATA